MTESGAKLDSTEVVDPAEAPSGLRTWRGKLLFNGEPIYLITTKLEGLSRTEQYDGTNPKAVIAAIGELASLQERSVRFCLRMNLSSHCYDASSPRFTPYADMDHVFQMEHFNPGYWALLRSAVSTARDHGILVEVALFDHHALEAVRLEGPWSRNPFKAVNGGPIDGQPVPAFYQLHEPRNYSLYQEPFSAEWPVARQVQYHQQQLVHHAVAELAGFENVCWEIVSELDGGDPVRQAFVEHYVEFLRREDPLDRKVSFSGQATNFNGSGFYRLTGVDTVQLHTPRAMFDPQYDLVHRMYTHSGYGKPVLHHASAASVSRQSLPRWQLWQALVAGGFATAEVGIGAISEELAGWLKAFSGFVAACNHSALYADVELVQKAPDEISAHAASSSDEAVVYLTSLEGFVGGSLSLLVPTGAWAIYFVDPATGSILESQSVVINDAFPISLRVPAFAEDLVLHFRRKERDA